jgi:type I restriction enzyme, S subunit
MTPAQPSTFNPQPPKGYKQTEVGVIPEEWEVRSLNQACSKITDGTHDTPTPTRAGVPFLTAIHIKEGSIDFDHCLFLPIEDYRIIYARCNPQRGDVLMVNIGAGVATTALVAIDFEFSLKNVALLKPAAHWTSGSYLNYSLIRRKPAIIQALSSGGAQPFLSLTQIGHVEVPLPERPEQDAIAEALSDVDGLLGGLDRLIAKKRDLKQAAMQQILTGQTRLPGFHGEWEVKRLNELADIRSGGTPSTSVPHFWDGDIPWCTPTDITALEGHKYLVETARRITAQGLKSSSAEMIPPHSVVMTSRATIGECAINSVPVSTNQGFKNFVPLASTDVEFLFYLLQTQKQGFIRLCGGSTFLEIGKTQLADYQVRLPATKAEQTAIAQVLTDMDKELAALEQRREKTRALKQAMMQELLTGKTRLIAKEEKHQCLR